MDSLDASPDSLLNQYRLSLETSNKSPKTVDWYLAILRRYFNFLKLSNLIKPVDELNKKALEAYITHRKTTKKWPSNPHIKEENKGELSPYSIQGDVRAIKAFWSWLLYQGHIKNNTLAKFPLPKVPKTIIKTLTIEQIRLLLKTIDKNSPVGARNYCILMLLIDTGMRISETTGIQITDLNLPKCLVKIVGKGQKERVIPFSPFTSKELLKYIKYHRPDLCKLESPYLFPSSHGHSVQVNAIQQTIKRLAKKAELNDIECHPHIFRHTFATMFLAKGGNAVVLKEIMGHESVQTTQKYIHLQPEDLQKQHWKYSPVEDLFSK
ncbi:tyrosine-type recombinase/integrase [Chloroflexota bacterium]